MCRYVYKEWYDTVEILECPLFHCSWKNCFSGQILNFLISIKCLMAKLFETDINFHHYAYGTVLYIYISVCFRQRMV